jgi:tRNA 2-thiocytidine biosynthesis protein TtcA
LQRNVMKQMIHDIETKMPGRKDRMIKALGNIRPSHMLDNSLFDFNEIGIKDEKEQDDN